MTSLQELAQRTAAADEIARQIGASAVTIRTAEHLARGPGPESWRLVVEVEGGRFAGSHVWQLRLNSGARITLSLDCDSEARVLSTVHDAGVMVAAPIAVVGGSSPPGRSFIVQPCMDGGAPAPPTGQDRELGATPVALARELGEQLARVHSITPPQPSLACLPVPISSPARAEVARLRAALDKAKEPRPALEYVLVWLEAHAPPGKPLTLVHGDFRTGNFTDNNGRLAGIRGWETAHWGDPDEDIGSMAARCSRRGNDDPVAGEIAPLAPFLEAYTAAAAREIPVDAVRYWQIMAAAKQATLAVLQGDRFRRGGELRLELALAGLTPAEREHVALSDIIAWNAQADGGPKWL